MYRQIETISEAIYFWERNSAAALFYFKIWTVHTELQENSTAFCLPTKLLEFEQIAFKYSVSKLNNKKLF